MGCMHMACIATCIKRIRNQENAEIIREVVIQSIVHDFGLTTRAQIFSNMAAARHEVTPDALPYYDQGYEEPEVREMV